MVRRGVFGDLISADCKSGQRKPEDMSKKESKRVKNIFPKPVDISRRAKKSKNRQIYFRRFSTLFAQGKKRQKKSSKLFFDSGMARVRLADLNGPKWTSSGQNGPFWSREC